MCSYIAYVWNEVCVSSVGSKVTVFLERVNVFNCPRMIYIRIVFVAFCTDLVPTVPLSPGQGRWWRQTAYLGICFACVCMCKCMCVWLHACIHQSYMFSMCCCCWDQYMVGKRENAWCVPSCYFCGLDSISVTSVSPLPGISNLLVL